MFSNVFRNKLLLAVPDPRFLQQVRLVLLNKHMYVYYSETKLSISIEILSVMLSDIQSSLCEWQKQVLITLTLWVAPEDYIAPIPSHTRDHLLD